MTPMNFTSYEGSVQRPFPPNGRQWAVVGLGDEPAAARAAQLGGPDGLPLWHFVDELTPRGFYRFFCAMAPNGEQHICALKYTRHGVTLGAEDSGDGGDAGASTDGGGAGDSGVTGSNLTDTSSGLSEGDSSNTDVSPPTPPGGGGGTTPPTKPASTGSSSSSNAGLIFGIAAALAVGGTIIAAAAAKRPAHSPRRYAA